MDTNDPWAIKAFTTDKNELPLTAGMKAGVIPKFPSLQLLVGRSGSGKSNLLLNLVTNPKLMGSFFDDVYLISPTAKSDDLVKHLKLEPDHIWDNLEEAVTNLHTLLDNQSYDIETNGILKTSKVLVICDDCVGTKQFMKSDVLTKVAIHGRHNLVSSIILTQSYTKVPRVIRLQSQGIALFPSSEAEVKLLNEDFCPPGCTRKRFKQIVGFATDEPYSFLFIQNHHKVIKERYRKKLSDIITI